MIKGGKEMKKKLLALVLTGILGVSLLSGCGSKEESASEPAAEKTEEGKE